MRVVVVCPGRGSYGAGDLGSLAGAPREIVDAIDRRRAAVRLPPIATLDGAPAFENRHTVGANAADLTFARSLADLAAVDRARVDVGCVIGNSMGWYTALVIAGALDLDAGARLVGTMAALQAEHGTGGQIVYPIVDDAWQPDPVLEAAVTAALASSGVYLSIQLGGSVVLGIDDGIDPGALLRPLRRGGITYPLRLTGHQAFHTRLVEPVVDHARAALADIACAPPAITLIGGDGQIHRPRITERATLREYTFGPQLVEPFDFVTCVRTAVGNFAPDALVLLGPGETLGGACGQILVDMRWRGLRDRKDFAEAQAGDAPLVIAMSRPAQRALVTARATVAATR
jgi:acyl transferase domain-containing protein